VADVYGYSAAQTMVAVLKQRGDNLTRENLMKQAESIHDLKLPMLLPGITASTGAGDFAPIKQILGLAGDGANLVEASRIDEERNALAHGQPAALMLALDLVAPRARSLCGASARRVRASSLCTPPGAAPLFDCSWFAPQVAPARVGERKGERWGE
jgi:hypothetical protein